jgi:hypothetical protein
MQTIQLAMQNSVSPRDIGVATSSGTFFRQMGGTLGTAVFLSVLFSVAPARIASAYQAARGTDAFKAAAVAHPDQLAKVTGGSGSLNDTSFLTGLNKTIAHPFLVGFSSALDLVFIVGAIVLVGALVLALMLKEVPLRQVSGLEAARAEAARAQLPKQAPSPEPAAAPRAPGADHAALRGGSPVPISKDAAEVNAVAQSPE